MRVYVAVLVHQRALCNLSVSDMRLEQAAYLRIIRQNVKAQWLLVTIVTSNNKVIHLLHFRVMTHKSLYISGKSVYVLCVGKKEKWLEAGYQLFKSPNISDSIGLKNHKSVGGTRDESYRQKNSWCLVLQVIFMFHAWGLEHKYIRFQYAFLW